MTSNILLNTFSNINIMEGFSMNTNLSLIIIATIMSACFFMYFNNFNTFSFAYSYKQLPIPVVFDKVATFVFSNFDNIINAGLQHFGEDRIQDLAEVIDAECDVIIDSSDIISTRKDFIKYIASIKNTTFGYIKYTISSTGFAYYVCYSSGMSRYDEHHVKFSSFNSKMKSGRAVKFSDNKLGTRSFIHVEYKEKDFLFKSGNCIAIIPSTNGLSDKMFVLATDEDGYKVFIDIKTKSIMAESDMVANSNALFYRFISRTSSQERKSTATFILINDYNNYKDELITILDKGTQGEFSNMVNSFKSNPNLSAEQKVLNVIGNIQTVGKNLGTFNKVAVVNGKITLYYEIVNKTTGKTELKAFTPFDGQGIVRASALAKVVTDGLQELGYDIIVLPKAVIGLSLQVRLHTDKGVLNVVSDKTFVEIYKILKDDYGFITYGYDNVNELPDVIMDKNQVKWLPINKDCNWLLYVLSISKLSQGNSSVQGVFDTLMEADMYNLINGKTNVGYENMVNYNAGVDLIKEAIEEKLESMINPAPLSSSALNNRPVTDVLMSIDSNTFNEFPAVRHSAIRRATNKIFNKYINKLSVPIDTYNAMLQCDWSALLLSEKNTDGKRIVRNVLKYNEAVTHLNSKEAVCVKYPKVAGEHHVINIVTPEEYMERVNIMDLPTNILEAIEDIYNNTWEGNVIVPAIELLFVKESGADCDGDKFSMIIDPMIINVYKEIDALGHSYIIMKDVQEDGITEASDYTI